MIWDVLLDISSMLHIAVCGKREVIHLARAREGGPASRRPFPNKKPPFSFRWTVYSTYSVGKMYCRVNCILHPFSSFLSLFYHCKRLLLHVVKLNNCAPFIPNKHAVKHSLWYSTHADSYPRQQTAGQSTSVSTGMNHFVTTFYGTLTRYVETLPPSVPFRLQVCSARTGGVQ